MAAAAAAALTPFGCNVIGAVDDEAAGRDADRRDAADDMTMVPELGEGGADADADAVSGTVMVPLNGDRWCNVTELDERMMASASDGD
jgi:hypothetical protein